MTNDICESRTPGCFSTTPLRFHLKSYGRRKRGPHLFPSHLKRRRRRMDTCNGDGGKGNRRGVCRSTLSIRSGHTCYTRKGKHIRSIYITRISGPPLFMENNNNTSLWGPSSAISKSFCEEHGPYILYLHVIPV